MKYERKVKRHQDRMTGFITFLKEEDTEKGEREYFHDGRHELVLK